MNQWEAIRLLARKKRAEIDQQAKNEPAAALIAAAASLTNIPCVGLAADDPLLYGAEAVLDPAAERIWYNQEIDPALLSVYKIHEYAHYWIEGVIDACSHPDLEARLDEEKSPVCNERVESYSPKERREAQANVFAREFLLPSDQLRTWFIHNHWTAADIAQYVDVPESLVFHQLTDALLLPAITEEPDLVKTDSQPAGLKLDSSQETAAHAPKGPLLVEAGPGTGKTRTLVGRVHHLITQQKVDPRNILVLTFSNKAAEEMRTRLAQVLPAEAPTVWMGTFHAFGLEIIRKYGYALGLPPSPKLLDPVSALLLMEQMLPKLELNHYQNLYDPTLPLRDFLQAISRAKDELVGPEKYQQMAEQMVQTAADDERERAEKVLEVASVYQVYQSHLDQEQLIDFADLIAKTVQLLADHADIRQDIRKTFRHVLVDEYQDVNRACALLLKQLAGDGEGLWVVGDARQSIYRFRGAAPENITWFSSDFPGGTTVSLRRNYRTQPPLVKTFSALAPRMGIQTTIPFEDWETHRPCEGGEVLMQIADDLEAEGGSIAAEIQHRFTQGISYRDQAVLCRSHTNLARIAALLEQNGIPTLYIGDLFERAEIRDLLSIIELAAGDARGFVRVATFPEYHLSAEDLNFLLVLAEKEQVSFPQAITRFKNETGLSEPGRQALDRLDQHLQDLCYGHGIWTLLAHYLYNRSSYLSPFLNTTNQAALQQRLAIYQFLRFVYEQDRTLAAGQDAKQRFLNYVRRLEIFGEEKQLRQIPEAGQGMNAVRLLTIHASKGLEFRAVYLPMLGKGIVPSRMQPQTCLPPQGMVEQDPKDSHAEEELCLFFVALSRARDVLYLSRARRYNNRGSNPSVFLDLITSALPPQPPSAAASAKAQASNVEPKTSPAEIAGGNPLQTFEVEALDLYIRCPRRYFYEMGLGFSRQSEETAFLRFHRCLRELLDWVQDQHSHTGKVELPAVLQQLDASWPATDLTGHPFEPIYRKNAEAMIARSLQLFSAGRKISKKDVVQIQLKNGIVHFMPDHIEIDEEGKHIFRRLRTGRVNSNEADQKVYGLYHSAAHQLTGEPYQVEVFSLINGKSELINLTDKKIESHRAAYDQAILGILADQFPPEPEDSRNCPRCPNYFICPAMPTD
jgi:DNA helicase II / ATP-dependent DNA helicase PcrA